MSKAHLFPAIVNKPTDDSGLLSVLAENTEATA